MADFLEEGDQRAVELLRMLEVREMTARIDRDAAVACARREVLGDLGLRKAVAAFYSADGDIREFGSRFAPFENLSAHYLLTGLRVMLPA